MKRSLVDSQKGGTYLNLLNEIQRREENREWPQQKGFINSAGQPIKPYIPNLTSREQRYEMDNLAYDPQYQEIKNSQRVSSSDKIMQRENQI